MVERRFQHPASRLRVAYREWIGDQRRKGGNMPKVRIDGTLEMHYEDDNITDPWKTAETVLFQHCNGGSSTMYYPWVPVVARHYRLIRVDRRGQGGSTVPAPGYPWSLKGWSSEMGTLMNVLGLQKVHLIGEATGSYACLQFAYEHPERVTTLTLINCVPNEPDSKLAERPAISEWGGLLEQGGVEGWVRQSMDSRFDSSQVDPEYIEWHAQEKIRQPHHVTVEVMKSMGTGILADVSDMLRQVKVPTLVMSGETGVIHNPETAQRIREMVPNCKLGIIPGVFGYIAHAAPEKCAEAWLDFAQGLG